MGAMNNILCKTCEHFMLTTITGSETGRWYHTECLKSKEVFKGLVMSQVEDYNDKNSKGIPNVIECSKYEPSDVSKKQGAKKFKEESLL